jgi:Putative adhesin
MHAKITKFLLLISLALLLVAPALSAQDNSKQFHWNGKLAVDNIIQVKGINGNIDARRAAGDDVEVTADISGPHADEVQIDVVPNADGVTVCEIYRGHNSCDHSVGHSDHDSDYNRTRINYRVLVPSTVHFHGHTINGNVTAENLDRSIKATSVNGSVKVSTKSWAEASSVNGTVVAALGSADWTGSLRISSVNGSITVALPPDANVEVSFSSINGHFSSELPVTTQSAGRGHMAGRIGSGGRDLHLSSVNGSVEIRKNLI